MELFGFHCSMTTNYTKIMVPFLCRPLSSDDPVLLSTLQSYNF